MSEQNIVNVMVIPDVPKVLPGEQLYVYVPKASFTSPGIIAYNNTQFRIDGNFLFIREDYVSPGVQQKIDELKQYTDDKLQLKQDKEDNNISLAQRPEQKSVVGAINDLGTLTQEAKNAADHAQTTADNATTLANTGISKAEQAQQTADHAQQDAETAQATADNATTLANTGISKADQAQTTANTAVDKANDAKATAQEAIMKADGRATSIGFMTAKDAVTALNGYPRNQLKGGDTIWIVETGTPDLWVTEVAENSVPYNYTTKDKFNQDLVDNKVLQIGYFKTAYQESDGKPVTIAWQNVVVKTTDWVASTEFADFPYEAKITLTDFVDYTTVPQVVFDIADTMSGNYAPICKSGDKCVYIYGKVQDEITLKTVITFAPNVNGASVTGGGYNNRGKWVASTTYEIDDLVYTDNGQYVCIEGITSTTSPEQDTQHWQATFVATGKTKNGLKIGGQNGNGTEVQKTFDGSTPVEVAFDEQTMTVKEVNGVLEVGAKGTIPEALPQEASAIKNGKLPTSGWTMTGVRAFWQGSVDCPSDEYVFIGTSKALADILYADDSAYMIVDYNYFYGGYYNKENAKFNYKKSNAKVNGLTGISFRAGYNDFEPTIFISRDGKMYGEGMWQSTGHYDVTYTRIGASTVSQQTYTISDTSITANSDILMELTDDGGVKSYSMEAGKITVIRDTVPTQPIPYTYKVKQTNASGQFTLVNHFVPSIPESPTSLPVSYKKASGELPTSGWSTLDEGWKNSTLPASRAWSRITYGNGKYVAVTFDSAYGAYSIDGITWTEMIMPTSKSWYGITYGNGKFVAVGGGSASGAYSTDGINWTEMTLPASQKWFSVTYGDGKYVAVAQGSNKGAYSTDGIAWTEMSMPESRDWQNVTYGNGKFVAVAGGTSAGAYSTDGITWTAMTLPASGSWYVSYGDSKFVAITFNSNKGAYSTNGINWTAMTLPATLPWLSITYGNGKYVAIANNDNKGAYSTDGINWTEMSMPAIRSWSSVTYGNGKFVAVVNGGAKGAYWKAAADVTYTISDTSITANTSVKMYLTDAGGVKAKSKANGSITVIRDTVPTTAIPYEYEVEQTSAEGLFEVINAYVPSVPTKTSQLTNDSGFVKASEANTWTGEQTFSNANGIKTNRVHNLNGNAWYDFDGSNNRFGSPSRPTIIRTSEARPKAEVPSGSSTVTKEIALLEDIPSAGEWVDVPGETATLTQAGTYQVVLYGSGRNVQSIIYWDGSTAAQGIYSTVVDLLESRPVMVSRFPQITAEGVISFGWVTISQSVQGDWLKSNTTASGFKYRKIN